MSYTKPLNTVYSSTEYSGKWSLDDLRGFTMTAAEKDAIVVNTFKDLWSKNAELEPAVAPVWMVDSLKPNTSYR